MLAEIGIRASFGLALIVAAYRMELGGSASNLQYGLVTALLDAGDGIVENGS